MNDNLITIAEAKSQLSHAVDAFFAVKPSGEYAFDRRRLRPLLLTGPIGIGKTDIIRQVAADRGLCEVTLPSCFRYDPTSPKHARCSATMLSENTREGILVINDFGGMDPSDQQNIVDSRQLGDTPIPDGWMIVLVSPENSMACSWGVAGMVRTLKIVPDYQSWRCYAMTVSANPAVISFLDRNPKLFYSREYQITLPTVTGRSWLDLSEILTACESLGQRIHSTAVRQHLPQEDIAEGFLEHYDAYHHQHNPGNMARLFSLNKLEKDAENIKSMSSVQRIGVVSAMLSRILAQAKDADAHRAVYDSAAYVLVSSDRRTGFWSDAKHMDNGSAKDFLLSCVNLNRDDAKARLDMRLLPTVEKADHRTEQLIIRGLTLVERAFETGPVNYFFIQSIISSKDCRRLLEDPDSPARIAIANSRSYNPDECGSLPKRVG